MELNADPAKMAYEVYDKFGRNVTPGNAKDGYEEYALADMYEEEAYGIETGW